MEWTLAGFGSALGLGFGYFLAAIPSAKALGTGVVWGAFAAWLGYSAGSGIMTLPGAALRQWIARKLRLPAEPGGWAGRVWRRGGVFGLGLIAPVTIGPQAGTLLAITLGISPRMAFVAFSLGVLPWCVVFAVLTAGGAQLVH